MKRSIVFLLFLFLVARALAVSGVNPVSYDVDFEPGLERQFVFDFSIEKGKIYDLEVSGSLAEYVTLSEKKVADRQKVYVDLKLPEEIATPGINEITIKAGDAVAHIRVSVPYPDQFIELELSAPDVNVGEIAQIKLDVYNKGNLTEISPVLEIYQEVNGTYQIINVMSLDKKQVYQQTEYVIEIVPGQYTGGNFMATAYVEYDAGYAEVNNSFRVGEKRLEIINYTESLKESKVGKFKINVESLWNSDLSNVYAQVSVIGEDYSFVTPSVKLSAWETVELTGFLDTRGIEGYDKKLEIVVYYDGESTTKIVPLKIYEGVDLTLILVIILVPLTIFFSIFMWKRFQKNVDDIRSSVKK